MLNESKQNSRRYQKVNSRFRWVTRKKNTTVLNVLIKPWVNT